MFIENLCTEELVFRAHGAVIKLKPGMNTVDNAYLTVDEITRHFGSLINVYVTHATVVQYSNDKVGEVKNEVLDKPNTEETIDEQKTNEPIGNVNNENTVDNSIVVDDNTKEQKDINTNTDGSTEIIDSQDNQSDSSNPQENESIQEEGKTKEKVEEESSNEEESTENTTPSNRKELIAKYKALNLEGNPIRMTNIDLAKAIEDAEKNK